MMSKTKYPYVIRKIIRVTTFGNGVVKYYAYVIIKEKWWIWPTKERYGVDRFGSTIDDYHLVHTGAFYISFDTEQDAASALDIAITSHFKEIKSNEIVFDVEKHI